MRCPKCEGKVVSIGETLFCDNCDWFQHVRSEQEDCFWRRHPSSTENEHRLGILVG